MSPRLSPHTLAARAQADPRARRAGASAEDVRAGWRRLIAGARALAERLVISDGEEQLGADDLTYGLAAAGRTTFPADGASAAGAAQAFILTLRAALQAGEPRRRAVIAPALGALAKALDDILTDQAHAAADGWKRQFGDD